MKLLRLEPKPKLPGPGHLERSSLGTARRFCKQLLIRPRAASFDELLHFWDARRAFKAATELSTFREMPSLVVSSHHDDVRDRLLWQVAVLRKLFVAGAPKQPGAQKAAIT